MFKEQEFNFSVLFYTQNLLYKGSDKLKMNFKEELFKSIQGMVNRAVANCKVDRTYQSIIKNITPKGYVVLDRAGSERTVQCCIPNVSLRIGQAVYVKEPMSDLQNLHIVGVIK